MSFPVAENGLAFRKFQDILWAHSCKIWWQWRTSNGLWSSYVRAVTWKRSVARRRLEQVDAFMRERTRVVVQNGTCSFLMDNC